MAIWGFSEWFARVASNVVQWFPDGVMEVVVEWGLGLAS